MDSRVREIAIALCLISIGAGLSLGLSAAFKKPRLNVMPNLEDPSTLFLTERNCGFICKVFT
jgi:hypothetical protein